MTLPPELLDWMVRLPVRAPTAVGAKAKPSVQLPPVAAKVDAGLARAAAHEVGAVGSAGGQRGDGQSGVADIGQRDRLLGADRSHLLRTECQRIGAERDRRGRRCRGGAVQGHAGRSARRVVREDE